MAYIAGVNASIDGKGFKRYWTVPQKSLVQILRSEINSQERAERLAREAARENG